MALKFPNRARMTTATTGTGVITLGAAVGSPSRGYFQSFADAGVANADTVRYVIEDGANWEIGTGTYTASGMTLSRSVIESSNADAAINLSGGAEIFATVIGADLVPADASVTNAKLANMGEALIKGRAAGAGTGVPVDLTASQVSDIAASASVSFLAQKTGANQSSPSATVVLVTFPTLAFNLGGGFNTGTSLFTVPAGKGGIYFFYGCCRVLTAVDQGELTGILVVNGTNLIIQETRRASGTGTQAFVASGLVSLNAGDTVSFNSYLDFAGILRADLPRASHFEGFKIT